MFVITGATGQLGRLIVQKLGTQVPATDIGVSVRDPEKAKDLAALGVRVRRGDFSEPAGLAHAFEGVTQLLLVSSNAAATGGDPLAQHRAAINAARTAGVKRIIYTSHMAASSTSAFPPMLDHAATEQMLHESGIAWTALRHGFYAQSALWLMEEAFKTGVLEAPTDGKVSWTAREDLAEVDVTILKDGRYEGPTPALTAPQTLDLGDLAAIAAKLQGKPMSRQIIGDDEFRAKMAAGGMPAGAVKHSLGFFLASRRGEFSAVGPTLEQLLRRSPISMQTLITEKIHNA